MVKKNEIDELFHKLLTKMEQQMTNVENQSFGSLRYHFDKLSTDIKSKAYLDPLYFLHLPRWLGEFGNTAIEEEIFNLAIEIDKRLVKINGGIEKVNTIRIESNRKNGFK
jgi:hypothetical protein